MTRHPKKHQRRRVTVYDIRYTIGGTFTVSIVREIDPENVEVRVWYGRATSQGWERWLDWDGYTFQARRDELTNEKQLSLFKEA